MAGQIKDDLLRVPIIRSKRERVVGINTPCSAFIIIIIISSSTNENPTYFVSTEQPQDAMGISS